MECKEIKINEDHFFENLMQTGRERDRVVTKEYKDKKGFSPWRELQKSWRLKRTGQQAGNGGRYREGERE